MLLNKHNLIKLVDQLGLLFKLAKKSCLDEKVECFRVN